MDGRSPQRMARAQAPLAGPVAGSGPEHRLASQVLAIVAVLTLSFLIELTVVGGLWHDRDQDRLAELFRNKLANSIAPVGPFDEAGQPLATGTPVALLEIPRLGVWEVVVEGTSSGTLMSGPGHRRDTPLPGQVGTSVIAGRRATYGGPFRALDQLLPRDQITVTTGQGESSFAVLGARRAGDPVPPILARGQSRITLVTTDGPALSPRDVLRVDAALVGEAKSRPPQLPAQALPPAEAVLAGDTSALWAVVGWSLLLLGAAVATVWVRYHAGRWQAWLIGVPVLATLGLVVADEVAAMLPNLL